MDENSTTKSRSFAAVARSSAIRPLSLAAARPGRRPGRRGDRRHAEIGRGVEVPAIGGPGQKRLEGGGQRRLIGDVDGDDMDMGA